MQDLSVGKDFLSRAPFAQELRSPVDKQDLIKLKSSAQLRKQSEEEGLRVGANLCQLHI